MKNQLLSFNTDLKKRLKNPAFKKVWKESETEYLLAKQLIKRRLEQKISQRDLAKKLHTSQAVVSRIETMRGNPSINMLKRIAESIDSTLEIRFT